MGTADAILCSVRSRKIILDHATQGEDSIDESKKLPDHHEAMRRCLW